MQRNLMELLFVILFLTFILSNVNYLRRELHLYMSFIVVDGKIHGNFTQLK